MTKQFKLLELRFSNILYFGENNCIDFRKNTNNSNMELLEDGEYKSGIYLAILYCLYGDKIGETIYFPDNYSKKQNSNFMKMIVNKNKKEFECSLLFTSGVDTYFVRRKGLTDYTKMRSILYKMEDKKWIPLSDIYSSEEDVNTRVGRLVGSYKNFLVTSSYMEVNGSFNLFTDLNPKERCIYLSNILGYQKLDEYLPLIEKCINEILGEKYYLLISIKEKNAKIQIKLANKKNSKTFYNVEICSFSERIFINLAIKYAFMKLLPCIKPNLFILDLGSYSNSFDCSNIDLLKSLIKKMCDNDINVFLLTSNKKMKDEDNYKLNVDNEKGIRTINNVGQINYDGIYSDKLEYKPDRKIMYDSDDESDDEY